MNAIVSVAADAVIARAVCDIRREDNTIPDERIVLKDYYAATHIYALTAKTLCR